MRADPFPAPISLHNGRMTATETPSDAARPELPVHLTQFIGRDRELRDLAALLPTARLLTLTGAGGSGKTRLAGETALRASGAFTRVAWADLVSLSDPELLAQQVAASLHAAERTDALPRDVIIHAIGTDRVLLVLDNCEHLVDACAELAETLLRACPQLTILATSRQALGVTSETAWLVPPLASPEALQLFAERARAVAPTFAVTDANAAAISEICRRLDGIPLAIELAAARVRVLSVEQIAQRLDDAFRLLTGGSRTALPRHRTLRATMEWSYGLLSTREQVLLRRLAVFAGTFSLDAAEAICIGEPLEAEDILDGVSALVEKSLGVMEAGERVARYRVLETVRQYGLERLTEANELEALEARHAEHFLSVIEAAAPNLFGGEVEPGLLGKLTPDNDNFRAAAAWSVRREGRARMALRFADAFFWYWYGTTMGFGAGLFREGRRFIQDALARASRTECDPFLRGRALASLGLIGLAQGDYDDATVAFDESLALMRAHGDEPSLILVLSKYGATRLMIGDLDHAWRLLEEALALIEPKRPYSVPHSFVYSWRGIIARARGDLATARVMHEANLTVGRYLKNRTTLGHGYAFLAAVDLAEGRVDDAFAHFSEALAYHLDLGDGWGLALDIEGFSAIAALRGRHADAVRLLGAVDALRERSAVALPASDAADRARRIALARSRVGDAYDTLYAEGRALSLDDVTRLATDESIVHTAEHRAVTVESVRTPAAGAVADNGARKPLKVLALGPLQVFVDGRLVDQAAWGSARPRELLVYLLMHPEGRTKEQAGLAFWPDASPTQLRNNFHVTLHRLRKALGNPDWVSLNGERYRIDVGSLVEEFDAATFEREVVAARRAVKRQAQGATHQLEQAIALYRGDFLDGEPAADWHVEHRERLQRMYIDALMELAAQHVKEERHAKAAEVYRRVLARDELHEDALRSLMRALADSGDRSQALRAYKRFSERLRSEMDAEPAKETLRLFERLQTAPA